MKAPRGTWPALLMLVSVATAGAAEPPRFASLRGITLSTHRGGQEWATAVIEPTMERLRAIGADWVAIHPYARIAADGTVSWRRDPAAAHVVHPTEVAHRAGLRMLIKPHLAYWGSPFAWRGDIQFSNDEQWQRFFTSYRAWILELAGTAADAGADGFVVGTELDRTLGHEERWRELIAAVRSRFPGPLTYAANWTDFERVPFWDALDAVGIQAYFPISDAPDPDLATLRRGWQQRSRELGSFSQRQQRPIVFTELGYNRSFDAARRPWDAPTHDTGAEALQARCLDVALRTIEHEPHLLGAFLWKWFPEPRAVGRDFQLATPRIEEVLRGVWTPPSRATAASAARRR